MSETTPETDTIPETASTTETGSSMNTRARMNSAADGRATGPLEDAVTLDREAQDPESQDPESQDPVSEDTVSEDTLSEGTVSEGTDSDDTESEDFEVDDQEAATLEPISPDAESQDAESQDAESPDSESLDSESLGDEATQVAAPAAPAAFGLLFQAPQAAPAGRRASRPAGAALPLTAPTGAAGAHEAQEPQDAQEDGEPTEGAGAPHTRDRDDAGAGPVNSETGEDDTPGARSRRRRGGRGRRRDQDEEAAAGSPAAVSESRSETSENPEPTDNPTPPDHADEAEDSETSRRRRRRRRTGAPGESVDPPGTVTRVREARRARDEVTSVKGSTRLEAKKQRRREGREAGRRRTIITEKEFLARRESVERVMVVRRQDGRTQIGVLEDGVLAEHYVSRTTNASLAGNIYLGRVQNVLPSMEAAFVDIGRGRNAVLYAGEVNWDAAGLESGEAKRIENVLTSGESVLVQVTKDPIGHKGARLTSQISLPGRYLVYVPQGSMTGISRKLPDTERSRLKSILKEIVPADAGVIVRTAAEGASEEELRRDVERLAKTWDKVSAAVGAKPAKKGAAPTLLYSEPDLTVRVIRDVFNEDFASLVISGDEVWDEISEYVQDVAPDLAPRMTKWTAEQDIFTAHRVDEQLAKALDRKVYLPSGGSLVLDRTEAMTVIDVNTGKFVGSGGNLEETVTKNNIEAAEEIVRQLRLRDIGGIIVIDFIDMVLESNRDLVIRRLLECLGRDRTKHQVAEVTSLGLVQMTRKRVASGLLEVFSETCECCAGRGVIVRSTPVDTPIDTVAPERSHGGGGGGSTSGGPGAGGANRSARRGRAQAPEASEPAVRSGPSAAQIAAAAHAAALKANGNGGHGDQADAGDLPDTVIPASEASETTAPETTPSAGPAAADQAPPAEPAPVDAARGSVETAGANGQLQAPAEEGKKPRRSRRRGRATAPAGPPRPSTDEPA